MFFFSSRLRSGRGASGVIFVAGFSRTSLPPTIRMSRSGVSSVSYSISASAISSSVSRFSMRIAFARLYCSVTIRRTSESMSIAVASE